MPFRPFSSFRKAAPRADAASPDGTADRRSPPRRREQADVETSSNRYARRFRGSVGRWFLRVQRQGVLRLLAAVAADASVLEVGAGHAQLTPALLDRGHVVTAYASDPVCALRLEPWRDHPRFRFETGDLLRLPYEDRSFDAVVSIRLLGHLPQWTTLVGELCRVSRGTVIVDAASARSLNALSGRLFALKIGIEGDTRPFLVFRPGEIRAAFARHGFRVDEMIPQYFLPMAFHRLLGSARIAKAIELVPRGLGVTRLLGSPLLVHAERARAPAQSLSAVRKISG